MARIVCQVIHRSQRVSFLWSDGSASFEPYHLEGVEREDFFKTAEQIHAALPDAGNGDALADLGRRLFRGMFRLDSADNAAAAAVHAWFTDLVRHEQVETIDFLSNRPACVPWNVLVDDSAAGEGWQRFFGARFKIGVGRRTNPIRTYPWLIATTEILAVDPELGKRLNASQRDRLVSWQGAGAFVESSEVLANKLRHQPADVLLVLARFDAGELHLGAGSFHATDLAAWLQASDDANPDPLVILMADGRPEDQSAWRTFLDEATCNINGLVANEVLLPAAQLLDLGLNLAQQFSRGEKSIADELRSLRLAAGSAGLAFDAFCPPEWRVPGAGVAAPPASTKHPLPLPDAPYRPLASFEAGDRSLFVGREDETVRCASLIDHADTRGTFLHGAPAAGKTSFLQAGLIPYLEEDSVGYQTLRDHSAFASATAERDFPVLLLRCTSDLAGQFADALLVFCAQPLRYTTPTGTKVIVDLPALLRSAVSGTPATGTSAETAIQTAASATAITAESESGTANESAPAVDLAPRELWIALRDQRDLLARILDAVTRSLPFELLIVIDQGEELVTLVRSPQQLERRQKALEMLTRLAASPARCSIVYTIRSQNLGELQAAFPTDNHARSWRPFFLAPLAEDRMADALLWPTQREEIPYSSEIPYARYGFAMEDGMAALIVAEAVKVAAEEQQSPLAILQAVGKLLYDNRVVENRNVVLQMTDVTALGGVRNALPRILDDAIARLDIAGKSREALRELIPRMSTSHSDGTLSRKLVLASRLSDLWNQNAEPVEEVVNSAAEDEGLLEIQQLMIGGELEVYVSLPQDSLAHLGRSMETESLRKLARTRVADTLWITIPLIFLAAAVAFFLTRNYMTASGGADGKGINEDQAREIDKAGEARGRALAWEGFRHPLYVGLLAEADQAIQAGNALRARQILLSQPAMRSYADSKKDGELPDVRGFEWRYLWHQLHSERHSLEGHRGVVNCVAISPDNQWAATGSSHDGSIATGTREAPIRIWNLVTGELAAVVGNPKSPATILALAFSPDGKTLASGGADKTVRLWDVSKLKADFILIDKEAQSLSGHTGAVHAVAFGKESGTLASTGADKSVILWDVAKGEKKHTLSEHSGPVHALAFMDAGKTLVSAGAESSMLVWDVAAGKKRRAIQTPYQSVFTLAVNDKAVATGGVENKLGTELGMIRFWDIETAKETATPIQHAAGVLSIAFQPDGKAIASGGKDHFVRLWNVASGKAERQWIGHLGWVRALAFSSDGATLVSASHDSKVKAWNPAQTPGPQVIAAHDDWIQAIALHPKNTLLASGARDGSVHLWDTSTGKLLLNLPALQGAITGLSFSHNPDKMLLAASRRTENNDGDITIWQLDNDPKKGWQTSVKQTLKDHGKAVTCLAFLPTIFQSQFLVSGGADHNVILWDAEAGKAKEIYKSHKDEVRCVAFAADGKTFVSGGKDRQVCAYEPGRKDFVTLPEAQLRSIESIVTVRVPLGNDHSGVITGGADHAIRMWWMKKGAGGDLADKKEFRVFSAHNQTVSALLYTERLGQDQVISAGWDGVIRIFDPFQERFTLVGHTGPVRALALASDQSFLVSAGNDRTIRIWRTQRVQPTNSNREKEGK